MITVALVFLLSGWAANAQINANKKPVVKTDLISPVNLFENGNYNSIPVNDEPVNYLQKSRNQKTGAWVLLGLGVAGIISGIIIEANNVVDNTYSVFADESTNNTGTVVAVAGGCMALGSIPFFVASVKNKKKATLSISNQRTAPMALTKTGKNITGITMSIPIGK